jgi:hypothetical protein
MITIPGTIPADEGAAFFGKGEPECFHCLGSFLTSVVKQ